MAEEKGCTACLELETADLNLLQAPHDLTSKERQSSSLDGVRRSCGGELCGFGLHEGFASAGMTFGLVSERGRLLGCTKKGMRFSQSRAAWK